MLKRCPLNPPQHIYPLDPWRITEKEFYSRFLSQTESIFSLGNGYLGMRGCFEEGTPVFENGTFINSYQKPGIDDTGRKLTALPRKGKLSSICTQYRGPG